MQKHHIIFKDFIGDCMKIRNKDDEYCFEMTIAKEHEEIVSDFLFLTKQWLKVQELIVDDLCVDSDFDLIRSKFDAMEDVIESLVSDYLPDNFDSNDYFTSYFWELYED
jgi:hypothetical protein